jgi:hypothetical protein
MRSARPSHDRHRERISERSRIQTVFISLCPKQLA